MHTETDCLLRAILATVARQTFPPDVVLRLIRPKGNSSKQISAYNFCDGRTSQSEIRTKAKLDKGNLSRSLSRWIDAGIVVRIGPNQHPLHVYPLTADDLKTATQKQSKS